MVNELKKRIYALFYIYHIDGDRDYLNETYFDVSKAIHKLRLENLITSAEYIELDDYIDTLFAGK